MHSCRLAGRWRLSRGQLRIPFQPSVTSDLAERNICFNKKKSLITNITEVLLKSVYEERVLFCFGDFFYHQQIKVMSMISTDK